MPHLFIFVALNLNLTLPKAFRYINAQILLNCGIWDRKCGIWDRKCGISGTESVAFGTESVAFGTESVAFKPFKPSHTMGSGTLYNS